MLRLLADENFNGYIVRGTLRRRPGMDLVRIQDVGLGEADDPAILDWAASEDRILIAGPPGNKLPGSICKGLWPAQPGRASYFEPGGFIAGRSHRQNQRSIAFVAILTALSSQNVTILSHRPPVENHAQKSYIAA